MDTIFFLVQQTWFFAIPLLVVALGGLFSERSGVINIALEGIMLIGALCGIGFIHIFNHAMPPQLLLLCAVLVAGAAGIVFSLFHAFAAIHMKADQVISGTALNTFALHSVSSSREPSSRHSRFSLRMCSVLNPFLYWDRFRSSGTCCSRIPT